MLLADELLTEPAQWIGRFATRPRRFRCTVKLRYRQADQPCETEQCSRTAVAASALMTPQRAVTPGQSAVFYDGEVCLGGA